MVRSEGGAASYRSPQKHRRQQFNLHSDGDFNLRKNSTSFLFSNFPFGLSYDEIRKQLFHHTRGLGRIVDLVIPPKLDRRGNRFGFVRFREVFSNSAIVRNLNNLSFDNVKIRAALANQHSTFQHPKFNHSSSTFTPVTIHNTSLPNSSTFDNTLTPPPPPKPFLPQSFAQIVQDQIQETQLSDGSSFKNIPSPSPPSRIPSSPVVLPNPVIDLIPNNNNLAWLLNCGIGETSEFCSLSDIQKEIWDAGFHFSVLPLGSHKFLLKSDAGFDMNDFIQNEINSWSHWFNAMYMWSPETATINKRTAWLRLLGLPLHAWSVQNFETVGNNFGVFIKADESSINLDSVDAARILIETSELNPIQSVLNIRLDQSSFCVNIAEELWKSDPAWIHLVDSGEIQSEEESRISEFSSSSSLAGIVADDTIHSDDRVPHTAGGSNLRVNSNSHSLSTQHSIGSKSQLESHPPLPIIPFSPQPPSSHIPMACNDSSSTTNSFSPLSSPTPNTPVPTSIMPDHFSTHLHDSTNIPQPHSSFAPIPTSIPPPTRSVFPIPNSFLPKPKPTVYKPVWDCYSPNQLKKFLAAANAIPPIKKSSNFRSTVTSPTASLSGGCIRTRNSVLSRPYNSIDALKFIQFGTTLGIDIQDKEAEILKWFNAMEGLNPV